MSARGLATTPHRRGDVLIGKALAMLDRRLRRVGEPLGSPYAVREFLQLHLAELEHREGVRGLTPQGVDVLDLRLLELAVLEVTLGLSEMLGDLAFL